MARSGDLSLGIVSGIAAGLAASFVMSEFQAFWTALDKNRQDQTSTPATLKAADSVATSVTGAPILPPHQKAASSTVHYLTGALLGGVYGALAEIVPAIKVGGGAFYGGAAWIVVDEGLTPMLGFGPSFEETPLEDHVYAGASHIVFGLTLELARAAMANVLQPRQARIR